MTTTTDLFEYAGPLFRLTPDTFRKCNSNRYIVGARFAVALALRRRGWASPKIAREMGYRDHTSILYACKVAEVRAAKFPEYEKRVSAIAAFHIPPLPPEAAQGATRELENLK